MAEVTTKKPTKLKGKQTGGLAPFEGPVTGGLAPFEGVTPTLGKGLSPETHGITGIAGAKKKKSKAPKKPKGTKVTKIGQRGQGVRPGRDAKQLTKDYQQAEQVYNSFFNFGDLPRVTDKYAQEKEDLLKLRGTYSDPNSASFAGRRSTDVSDILSRMKGGLEGYTAAENANIYEAMNRNAEADLQSELKNVQDTNAGNMVLGGAATARVDAARRNATRLRMQNNQDLFIKNIDEKRSRLNEYAQAVQGAEANEWNRTNEAMGNYEKTLAGNQDTDFALQQANIELEKQDRGAKIAGLGGLVDQVNAYRGERKQDNRMKKYWEEEE